MTINERIEQLRIWDAEYAADVPSVADAVYDAFRDETWRLAPDDPYFRSVGSPPRSAWPKRRLGFPMGSLDKAQTPEELRAWFPRKGDAFVSLKLDGISLLMRWEAGRLAWAATRGDGEVGEDITENVRRMRGVPGSGEAAAFARDIHGDAPPCGSFTGFVRGEIVLRKSVFKKHFEAEGYRNCRNAAGGAAKDLGGGKCHLLDVMCYQIRQDDGSCWKRSREFIALRNLGFRTAGPGWIIGSAEDAVRLRQEFVDGRREELDFDIDGLVVEVDGTDAREAMGETNGRPAGAVAFKFPPDAAETTLRDIAWQTGPSGRITPVAIFDPVELAGVTVERASLHNVANIARIAKPMARSWLAKGDPIIVSRRNDVIPYVESLQGWSVAPDVVADFSAAKDALDSPSSCPACGSPTRMDGEYFVCPNKAGCQAQTAGSILRWLEKIGVKEWGSALVEALCETKAVSEPADLYRLDEGYLAALYVGGRKYGKSAARTALGNLRARMSLPLHVLVGSLGIPMWSRSMCKLLVAAGYDTIGKMEAMSRTPLLMTQSLMGMPGVEATKANAFVHGFAEVLPKIKNLLAAGVSVAAEAEGAMKGATVCMTGFRDAAMEAAVEAQGGTVKSSAGKNLTWLVAKDPSGASGKLDAARKNGTKVVGVEEMWTILGGRP